MMLSTELLAFYRQVSQRSLTVVDVETTGSQPHTNRVTEISVLRASLADGVQWQHTHLVNPETLIPPRIVAFTGITQDMVDAAAPTAQVLPDYLPWLNEGVLTAHNLEFDYGFLQAEYRRMGTTFARMALDQFCTVQFARLMLPQLRSRSLPDLVRHFGFQVGRSHRAEADTLACWLLAEHLLHEMLSEPDEVLLERFGKQWLPLHYAAQILGCSQEKGRSQLEAAGITYRMVTRFRQTTPMYRRGDVERVFYEAQGGQQLSLLSE
ncbi:3'-5' exonuclease [Leptolyngbya sp. AN02str]|uniref:3'-5' exonuclease n=1 Tax=Leptolyngbya sp. AN02str TaxID=3423363 RepID=UPI003D323D41